VQEPGQKTAEWLRYVCCRTERAAAVMVVEVAVDWDARWNGWALKTLPWWTKLLMMGTGSSIDGGDVEEV
jgi:hypothetical protein